MKRTISGAVVMMGLFLGCATAAPPQQAQSQQAGQAQGQQADQAQGAEAKKDPDKTLICEEVAVTGSHIPRKICRTLRQVQKERDQAEKAVRDADRVNPEFGK